MRNHSLAITGALSLALALPSETSPTRAPTTLTVFAAASLADAFSDLGRRFEGSHPGVSVRFNFAGSQQLAAQIQQGAGADIFASADLRWMSAVTDGGFSGAEPRIFARNRLVVIVPTSNPARLDALTDLQHKGIKLVLAADQVPVGRYSREALGKLASTAGFPPDYARRVLANVVSEEDNVKSVVAKVQLGEADAGLVYRSDVTPAVSRMIHIIEIPESANVLASYPITVLKRSLHSAEARAFVDMVLAPEGQAGLLKHGFIPAATEPAPAGT